MKKLVCVLLVMCTCFGVAGCGNAEPEQPTTIKDDGIELTEANKPETMGEIIVSENDSLPHDISLKLSDKKDVFSKKELLVENKQGIKGVWDSSSTWHVENSDFKISYDFDSSGMLEYALYTMMDATLTDIEFGFVEVTAKHQLKSLYGYSDGPWKVQSNGNTYNVTFESDKDKKFIKIIIMIDL